MKPSRYYDASPSAGLAPVHDARARVLVLGSFPGVASLQASAYYAHPRNQFWPIIAALTGRPLTTMAYDERLRAVRDSGLAIWDVVERCNRRGSLDSAIRDACENDFGPLLDQLPELRAVAFNGNRAARAEALFAARGYATHRLPSTSPAYAGLRFEAKLTAWRVLEPLLLKINP